MINLFNNQTILITGGTGSFGHAFVEYILKNCNPHSIRVYSRDEMKQNEMRQEFNDDPRLRFLIGDVRDLERLKTAMGGVHFVVHAAALKQVPSCEFNPFECVKTNVLGAQNIVEAAIYNNVPKVIALSTDKAVNPINLYGATKLCQEKLIIQGNVYSKVTTFACVRYGNVIGSRGSVIPLWKKLAAEGKPLPVTDANMTRFWLQLEDAVQLVLNAYSYMLSGEIYVPKMKSAKMMDVLHCISDKHEKVGIRPGEKIHETLVATHEISRTYDGNIYFVIEPEFSFKQRIPLILPPAKLIEDYRSDNNTQWMSMEEMKKIIKEIK